jgi:capsular polysaccharide transport system permease protein
MGELSALWRAFAVEKRVWGALFMREIQIRWGRRNLGFAWLFAEPLVFAFPVLVLWSFIRSPYEHGLPLMPFVWSGYLPLLLFRHTTSRAIYVVRQSAAMLYHRAVTPLDLVVARCGMEMIGGLAAMAFSYVILYILGSLDLPRDFPLFLTGCLYTAWWAFAVALLIAAASERSEMVEHIWMPVSYIYLPVSGFMYLAEWLPTSLRGLALAALPSLQTYEMIRGGLFGHQIRTFYDLGYTTYFLATLTLIGLWLMRDVRRHLEIE